MSITQSRASSQAANKRTKRATQAEIAERADIEAMLDELVELASRPPPGEQIETRSNLLRGMGRRSLDLIDRMYAAAEKARPITGRGIGYKLFTAKLIASMQTGDMQRVYRLLKKAPTGHHSVGVDRR